MIAKIILGRGFRGALDYLLEGEKGAPRERANIINSNMAGVTPRQLSQEFGVLRRLRPTLGKAVCHASISLSPNDRKLSDQEFAFIAKRFLVGMGFEDCPYVVVRHEDTTHQHIHVLVSRIKTSGEVVSDKNNFTRAEKLMRDMEQMYSLQSPTDLPTQRKVKHDAVNKPKHGGNKMKNEIRAAVEEAIREAENFREFVDGCQKRGVQPLVHFSGNRMCGFAFRKGNLRCKGSELGKMFTWDALRQRLDYQEATDLPVLEELLRIERDDIQSATCPAHTDAKSKREEARRLLDDDYLAKIQAHFGDELANVHRDKSMLEFKFADGGKLRDFGNRITAEDADTKMAAKRMIALAILKGWPAVSFSGNDEFVREAMRAAIAAGLPIVTKDAAQERLLAEVVAEGGALAASAVAPQQAEAVRNRIDALRSRHQAPSTPAPNQPQRYFKL